MNNEDMSEMLQNFSNIIKNSKDSQSENFNNDISSNFDETSFENLQTILSNMNFNNSDNSENKNNNYDNSNNNNFNLDFETIMKMKRAMDVFNSSKNSPEANLLLSLKPYLNNRRKQKLEQYIQFLNISKVFEAFNNNGGANNNDISK